MRADMFVVEGVEVEVDCLGNYRYVLGDMLEGGGWCLFGVLLLACLLAGRRSPFDVSRASGAWGGW